MDAEKFCFSSTPDVDNIELTSVPFLFLESTNRRCPVGSILLIGVEAYGRIQIRHKKGIHVERKWHPSEDSDGKWGWSTNVWAPIPIFVFDKVESRFFKLVGEVWISCEPMEKAELTFISISVLLRKEL